MVGPTQLTPMYWAPRGSWWAHISSRTTVCSHGEAPRPPHSSGQAMHSSPRSASSRQNCWATSRSAGSSVKAPEEVGRDVLVDQLAQLAAQRRDVLAHVEVHRASP